MRNFYCTAYVDDRKTPISFCPRSKTVEMSIDLRVNTKEYPVRQYEFTANLYLMGNLE